MMKQFRRPVAGVLVAAFAVSIPLAADAHRQWLLPSATILSGKDPWVTIDAAVSNDLFYFEHNPMRLSNLQVTNPDGSKGKVENQSTGKYRSTFDLQLATPGTYKVAVVNNGVFARYKEGGQQKRWMGTAETFATAIPANAEDLNVTEAQGRVETFVTAGKPTDTVLKPTGIGLELAPITHPNDMVAKGPANFQLLLDGKPAADLEVEVVPGGIRYRDRLDDMKVKTDAEGKFSITWPAPGMYWMEASVTDKNVKVAKATQRRASYVATMEVMPE
jgi:uncharacterized GH25 family protein